MISADVLDALTTLEEELDDALMEAFGLIQDALLAAMTESVLRPQPVDMVVGGSRLFPALADLDAAVEAGYLVRTPLDDEDQELDAMIERAFGGLSLYDEELDEITDLPLGGLEPVIVEEVIIFIQ